MGVLDDGTSVAEVLLRHEPQDGLAASGTAQDAAVQAVQRQGDERLAGHRRQGGEVVYARTEDDLDRVGGGLQRGAQGRCGVRSRPPHVGRALDDRPLRRVRQHDRRCVGDLLDGGQVVAGALDRHRLAEVEFREPGLGAAQDLAPDGHCRVLHLTAPYRHPQGTDARPRVVAQPGAPPVVGDDGGGGDRRRGVVGEDEELQLALGKAVANAVEHAYPGETPGELSYQLDRAPDGAVQVEVHDEGTWRPPPLDPGYRGRGLDMIAAVAQDVAVDTTGPGTVVRFTLPAPPEDISPSVPFDPTRPQPSPATTTLATLVAERDGAALVLRLAGDITVGTLRDALLDQVRAAPSDITLDVRDVTYLASAGVGC